METPGAPTVWQQQMKLSKVTIRNFKRFRDEAFDLDGHVVVAGPNNSGKTTLLQAVAAWSLALQRWRQSNDYQRHGGAYTWAPIARQTFYAVPLRAFDLLWHERGGERIQIAITCDGIAVPVEIKADSSEQVYVRPGKSVDPEWLRNPEHVLRSVFVPAMTGLTTEEPVYQPPKIDQLLGQGKPGDVLRNLLAETCAKQDAWDALTQAIREMFHYELLPPNADGAHIIAEYRPGESGATYDIASAGSGFLQVLMLLTFLHSRPGTVLLLDEPDAHLHVILQDGIYGALRAAAQQNDSQLVIATHSEVVINAVDPRELCALVGKPRKLANDGEKAALLRSLFVSNMDLMLVLEKRNILYVEGHTDLRILQAWSGVLGHRLQDFLAQPCWKPSVSATKTHGRGMKAQDHFEALLLAGENTRGAQLSDRDNKENIPDTQTAVNGKLLKLCWRRYEIENYLIHPAALARFVGAAVGPGAPLADLDAMQEEMRKHLPGAVVDEPLRHHDVLVSTKMRKSILPDILGAAGLLNFPYTRYAEIAAGMRRDEIHPEIAEKLDAIADHFDI